MSNLNRLQKLSNAHHRGPARPSQDTATYDNFYTPQNKQFYDRFEYEPLDATNEEIRVLEIDLSGRGHHKMIQKLPLHSGLQFSAVSYYSGDSRNTGPMTVNGVLFNAFRNLITAIESTIGCWRAKYPGTTLYLWTDQVCINQSDPAEKSHQVNMMRAIYKRSVQVFISMPLDRDVIPGLKWLQASFKANGYEAQCPMEYGNMGSCNKKPSRDQCAAWDLIYDILEHEWWTRAWVYQEFIVASRAFFLFSEDAHVPGDRLTADLLALLEQSVPDHIARCKKLSKRIGKDIRSKASWASFVASGCCGAGCTTRDGYVWDDYRTFIRLWEEAFHDDVPTVLVVAYCSPYVWLGFGGYLLAQFAMATVGQSMARMQYPQCMPCSHVYRDLPDNQDEYRRHIERLQQPSNSRSYVSNVLQGKRAWTGDAGFNLAKTLRHARNTRSSEPKDKIYAFLGVGHPDYAIRIDYTRGYSMNSVMTDTARAILLHEPAGYDILRDAGTAASSRRITSVTDLLPSWVPDWASEESLYEDQLLNALNLPEDICAGGTTHVLPSFECDAIGHPNRILVLRGVLLDLVGRVDIETGQSWRRYGSASGVYEFVSASVAQDGDEVWVLQSVKWPVVLRHRPDGLKSLLAHVKVLEGGQDSPVMRGSMGERAAGQVIKII